MPQPPSLALMRFGDLLHINYVGLKSGILTTGSQFWLVSNANLVEVEVVCGASPV